LGSDNLLLNKDKEVEECDATEVQSSNAADLILHLLLHLEKERFTWTKPNRMLFHIIKRIMPNNDK
jgi:hypothetical protein